MQSIQHDQIEKYRKNLAEDIFSCMELSNQSYIDVVQMPVKKMYDYLKWKTDLEESRQKQIRDKTKTPKGKK